jgi:HPt (histidine-containing phosphotransfer) domain-containing protein
MSNNVAVVDTSSAEPSSDTTATVVAHGENPPMAVADSAPGSAPPALVVPISVFAQAIAQAPAHIVPPELKVINWEEAMVQVGGDQEFLDEVLTDLTEEAAQAQTDISEAMKAKDFVATMKAAHRIKGSTSYLCCEVMNHCALKMEILASSQCPETSVPATCTADAAWVQLEELFCLFNKGFEHLKTEIANHNTAS